MDLFVICYQNCFWRVYQSFLSFDLPFLTTTYFGDGALTIKHIFEEAKKEVLRGNRVVLFFDEFDSIGNRKNEMSGSGGQSQKATLNALLTEMNSINDYEGRLVVITATNDKTAIDEALTRSKRFGRSVVSV